MFQIDKTRQGNYLLTLAFRHFIPDPKLNQYYIPLTNRVREPYRKLWTEFFPPRFKAQARSALVINRREKNEDP